MSKKVMEFKERLEVDEDFLSEVLSTSNLDEIIELARENGYDIDVDDILENSVLADQLLEAVVGGEDDTYTHRLIGNNNIDFTVSSDKEKDLEEVKKEAEYWAKKMVEELHSRGIYGISANDFDSIAGGKTITYNRDYVGDGNIIGTGATYEQMLKALDILDENGKLDYLKNASKKVD